MNLNIEDVCIDLYYLLDESYIKKGKIVEYDEFCGQEYQGALSISRAAGCSSQIIEKNS